MSTSQAVAVAPVERNALPGSFDKQAALQPIITRPGGDKLMDLTFLQSISASSSGKKRTLSLGHDDDDVDEDDTTSADGSDAKETPQLSKMAAAQQAKKQRKPTHVLRKEAKEKLLEELRHLEARAALLRQETGQADPRETNQKFTLNADLREAILQQDLIIANSQSAFSGYMNSRATSPLETYIHLTKDWNQRRDVLLAMKDRKVCDANRFLVERTRHLNPFKASREVSQFESEEGDLCTIKIDVTPFEGVKSVRQVFEAMQFYFMNLEISLTEMLGSVTIRENDDNVEKAVLHHRLVTAEPSGVLVEKNAVVFMDQSDFDDAGVKPEDHWAIAVGDFVDQDDLYPYCPMQRLRKDATSVLKLSAYRRPKQSPESASTGYAMNGSGSAISNGGQGDGDDSELVVVLTRWYLVRLRRPAFDVPKEVFNSISNDQSGGIDVMLRSMRQGIFPTAASWASS